VERAGPTWVFDVDGCLVDSLTGTSLRPGAAALLGGLRERGIAVVLWSAGGGAYARQRAMEQGIADLVDEFHAKEQRDHAGRYMPHQFLAVLGTAVFVDDRPEDMPEGARVVTVSPYLSDDRHDRVLARVAQRAGFEIAIGE
jgi:long-chain acyl-CoA synthetase